MKQSPLWTPTEEQKNNSNMRRFMEIINQKHALALKEYPELYEWSVDNIEEFWALLWEYAGIKASKPYERVLSDAHKMPGAHWFPGARLNFAQNLLKYNDEHTAIIFKGEDKPVRRMSYRGLNDAVAHMASAMKKAGVQTGDRVAGFMPNIPETIVAMLAATSLGAVWSSCSPDFGIQGVIDRFGQIKPKVLFTADGYFFKGKPIDSIARASEIADLIESLEKVVVVPYVSQAGSSIDPETKTRVNNIKNGIILEDFLALGDISEPLQFVQLPFEHPVYIMYSSGTTGLPKCMVQGPGVLLNHLKELLLHTDLKRDERIFYFTTCGWMMWNWLTSTLGTGATLVLFDGNPFYPDPGVLWRFASEESINVFGTSARYLKALEDSGLKPGKEYNLESIRTILSTGSPLAPEQYEYVYQEIKSDVQLASISGGTDLNGCFALGNPLQPVYEGELQCRGLGMKVDVYDEGGASLREERGELVCTAPFPSMPLEFWQDPRGEKYHNAYFDVYENIWRHGDYVELTRRDGMIVHGRSDATLNPGGVRIGTADIYGRVEHFPEIADSVVIGQEWENDVRVILFVLMSEGRELDEDLISRLKKDIREHESPRHVPAKIIAVPDIPYTLNMKKVELAVKKIVQGQEVKNKDALRNPECLNYFKDLEELQR